MQAGTCLLIAGIYREDADIPITTCPLNLRGNKFAAELERS